MLEEPYRWLEAIRTRRDYIDDQLLPGQPAVMMSLPAGILLATIKTPVQKLFEIYDNMALAAVGHPADVEKVRQLIIDAAHLEGFNRSPRDVAARRLVSYNLAPALKAAFEQIFSAPLLFRGLVAELGVHQELDSLWSIDYGGEFVSCPNATIALTSGSKVVINEWLNLATPPAIPSDLPGAAKLALRVVTWARTRATRDPSDKGNLDFKEVSEDIAELKKLIDKPVEFALLDRSRVSRSISYRIPTPAELQLS